MEAFFFAVGNKGQFVSLLDSLLRVAEDTSDPTSERTAFAFLGRCVNIWGQPNPPAMNGMNGDGHADVLPGFDRFIYERLVPLAFSVPSSPTFNIKDGQMLVVSHDL